MVNINLKFRGSSQPESNPFAMNHHGSNLNVQGQIYSNRYLEEPNFFKILIEHPSGRTEPC